MKREDLIIPANAEQIMDDFRTLSYDVGRMRKVYKGSEIFNHISGKKVVASFVVPLQFFCHENFAAHELAVISTLGRNLETDWLKLHPQSRPVIKSMSIKGFLELPDWTEDMQPLLACAEVNM